MNSAQRWTVGDVLDGHAAYPPPPHLTICVDRRGLAVQVAWSGAITTDGIHYDTVRDAADQRGPLTIIHLPSDEQAPPPRRRRVVSLSEARRRHIAALSPDQRARLTIDGVPA